MEGSISRVMLVDYFDKRLPYWSENADGAVLQCGNLWKKLSKTVTENGGTVVINVPPLIKRRSAIKIMATILQYCKEKRIRVYGAGLRNNVIIILFEPRSILSVLTE